jgi:hypothetical protein
MLFPGKKQTSGFGAALLKQWVIKISRMWGVGLKEFCCV